MTPQDAKNILTGAVSATQDQIAEAHDLIYGVGGVYDKALAAQAAKFWPTDPPYGAPTAMTDSFVPSTDAGVFMSPTYALLLNYHAGCMQINTINQQRWSTYAQEYRNDAEQFNTNSWIGQPPPQPAYLAWVTEADYLAANGNVPQPTTILAQKVSSYDYAAAIAAKQAAMDHQAQNQPALGKLLEQSSGTANSAEPSQGENVSPTAIHWVTSVSLDESADPQPRTWHWPERE